MRTAAPFRIAVDQRQKLDSQPYKLIGKINGKYATAKHSSILRINQSKILDDLRPLHAAVDIRVAASAR